MLTNPHISSSLDIANVKREKTKKKNGQTKKEKGVGISQNRKGGNEESSFWDGR